MHNRNLMWLNMKEKAGHKSLHTQNSTHVCTRTHMYTSFITVIHLHLDINGLIHFCGLSAAQTGHLVNISRSSVLQCVCATLWQTAGRTSALFGDWLGAKWWWRMVMLMYLPLVRWQEAVPVPWLTDSHHSKACRALFNRVKMRSSLLTRSMRRPWRWGGDLL